MSKSLRADELAYLFFVLEGILLGLSRASFWVGCNVVNRQSHSLNPKRLLVVLYLSGSGGGGFIHPPDSPIPCPFLNNVDMHTPA